MLKSKKRKKALVIHNFEPITMPTRAQNVNNHMKATSS